MSRQKLIDLWRRIVIGATSLDLTRARLLHDKPSIVDDLIEIGRRRGQGLDPDRAESAFLEAQHLATALNYDQGIARSASGLAFVARLRNDSVAAAQILESELPRIRRLSDRVFLANTLNNLGEALVPADRLSAAAAAYGEALVVAGQVGAWREEARAVSGLASVDYLEERLDDAFERWNRALTIYKRHLYIGGVAHMQHWLSIAAGRSGRHTAARQYAVRSLRNYQRAGRPDIAARAREYLAEIDEYLTADEVTSSGEPSPDAPRS